jgi:hypothetical protein
MYPITLQATRKESHLVRAAIFESLVPGVTLASGVVFDLELERQSRTRNVAPFARGVECVDANSILSGSEPWMHVRSAQRAL